jgi:hypothetical protein
VARVQIKPQTGRLIVENQDAHERLRVRIEELTQARPVTLQAHGSMVRVSLGYDASVTINVAGDVAVQSNRLGYKAMDELKQKVASVCEKLGIDLSVDQMARTIRARYGRTAVLSDQTVGANKNLRVLKVRL